MFGILVCLSMFGEVTESEVTVETPAIVERVETAARRYRISVYDTYRKDRPTYDQRIDQANEVLGLAEKLPQRSSEHSKLIVWFESAKANLSVPEADVPAIPSVDFEVEEVYAESASPVELTETFQTAPSSWLTQPGTGTTDTGTTDTPAELTSSSWLTNTDESTNDVTNVQPQAEATGPLGAALKSIGGILGGTASPSRTVTEIPAPPAPPVPNELLASDDEATNETSSWEAAKQELQQATADLQESKQDFETLQTELRVEAQEDLQTFERDLQALTQDLENIKQLNHREAMNLLMRITALDFGRAGAEFGLAVAGEGNEQQFNESQATTKQLLSTLRQRVAGKPFQGTEGERTDLLTKIDAILQLRQN